jgi:hypothetical protein
MLRHLVARFQGLEIGFELQLGGHEVHHLRGKINTVGGNICDSSYLAQTPGGLVQSRFRDVQAAQGSRDGIHSCTYRPPARFFRQFIDLGLGRFTEIRDLFGL